MVSLAAAFSVNPEVLFLDEPTSGLDPRGRVSVLELIRDLAQNKGLGVILSTHLLADVEAVCREIVVLRQGELLARQEVDGSGRQLRQVFEVEGFGDTEGFLTGLSDLGATVTEDQRLLLVTLDMERIAGAAGSEGWNAAAGVNAILGVAARRDFALRRLRRRPVSLADEFYEMVEA